MISDGNPTPREDAEDDGRPVDEQAEPAGNDVTLTTDDDAQGGDEQPIKTDNA